MMNREAKCVEKLTERRKGRGKIAKPEMYLMKRTILFLCCSLFSLVSVAQKQTNQIEINPFIRLDNYPGFTYNYRGRASTDYLKMTGTSYGITLFYKHRFKNILSIKAGLGYYQYGFNKLNNTNSNFGKSNVRPIDYVGPVFYQISTDRYHYDNIAFCVGIEKEFSLKQGIRILPALNVSSYYNIKQYYHLHSNPNDGNLNFYMHRSESFGFSGTASASVIKQFHKLWLGPSIILPVYDSWKKDPVFLEEDYNSRRHKWFNGVGVGFVCIISLNKK